MGCVTSHVENNNTELKVFTDQKILNLLESNTYEDLKLDSLDGETKMCKIVDVYDGDTYTIVFYIGELAVKRKLRLYGIDTPEVKPKLSLENHDLHKQAGQIARDYVKKKFDENKNIVKVKFMQKEKYGREMGVVYINNKSLAQHLIEEKIGLEYTGNKKIEFTKKFLQNIINK